VQFRQLIRLPHLVQPPATSCNYTVVCICVSAGARVALRNDSYALHILLPSKIDPLVSLMKVEKVPDSTYDMIGGCDQQIKEIKEVGQCCSVWLMQLQQQQQLGNGYCLY
jgi:ATP-dependent 26S proteasome regulatory subunit